MRKSLSYIDNNDIWTKEELDTLPGLAGLYDDLNNFNLDALTTKWADKLSGSKSFNELVKFANEGNKQPRSKSERTKVPPFTPAERLTLDYSNISSASTLKGTMFS